MEENIARTIRGIKTWDEIKSFEANAKARDKLTTEIAQALAAKSTQLGRQLVAERTNIDVSILTPAEEKIIEAVSEYTALLKSQGKYPGRTFEQIKNRGLIGAAEESVTKSKPTQGFTTLEVADLESLSYEQIIVDHEIEFTQRALWFAKRTLGLPVDTDIAPVAEKSAVQTRTIAFIHWIRSLTSANDGTFPAYSNAAAAKAMGIVDTQKYGRVLGNIQSRIDYACLLTDLPPIGLAADHAFDKAWGQEDRSWAFPVTDMRSAALSRIWADMDFTQILERTGDLPGQAHLLWKSALTSRESWVKNWAFGLSDKNAAPIAPPPTIADDTDSGSGNTKQERVATDLGLARTEADAAGDFDPSNVADARKKILAAIVRRQGQPAFRRELLRAYNGRCAVTGCQVAEVLEAAHIMPYRGPHTNHVSNGLLLRTDLHTLFDLGLIAVDQPSMSLIVARSLHTTEYAEWNGKTVTLPAMPSDHPNAEALRIHREATDI